MKQWFYVYRQWLLRELHIRFRSSSMGLAWLVLQPLVHIILFTLVFYKFFQIRWPSGDGSPAEYGLQVFIGLSLYSFVAEIINRGPGSVWSYPYLVTKVRFPLLLLPGVLVGSAGVQLLLSLMIALALAALRDMHIESLLLPIFLLPLAIYGLALAWFLGAAGVYLRDIGHLAPSVSSLLMFLTPIFYPASMIPKSLSWLVNINPLGWTSEAARSLLMHGLVPSWQLLGTHLLVSVMALVGAWWFFQRTQPGFADVL